MVLKPISVLWIGDMLSYIEQLCIRSHLASGHAVHFYSYGPVSGVDPEVDRRDARTIFNPDDDPRSMTYDQVEVAADRFKYRLLAQEDTIWADLDMLSLRAWDLDAPYLMSWQRGSRVVGGAVVAMPKVSLLLSKLNGLASDPTPIPPWLPDEDRKDLEARRAAGRGLSADQLKRGAMGVHALSWFVKELDLTSHVQPREAFFPCDFSEREALTNPVDQFSETLGPDHYGVHLWGRRLRRSVMSGEMRIPAESSFLGKMLAKHDVKIAKATTTNVTSDGLIKQNTGVGELEVTELRRAMAALEKKAEVKFDYLPEGPVVGANKFLVISAMKNEGPFILEWIAYHLSIGVSNFLIYTNDCNDGTNEILDRLSEMGLVTRMDNPFKRDKGQKPQRGALNDAIQQPVFQNADWAMCIDVDEFINVHVGDGSLTALVEAANQPNVISLTWRFFGNEGVERYEDRFITEQFTACAPEYLPKPRLGWGFKTMFHKTAPYKKLGVHRPLHPVEDEIDKARWVNGSGRMMPEMLLTNNGWRSTKRSIGYSLATLNHYVLRSAESYLVKRERGRINHVDQDQGLGYWQARNYVTDQDERILGRLGPAKARFAELKADPVLGELHDKAVEWHQTRISDLQAKPEYHQLYQMIISDDPSAEKQEEEYKP
ncbi:MAG: glycosyltransferase family 2 protein [Pikeienuella sp.]